MQLDTNILDRMMDELSFTPEQLKELGMKFWISKDYEFNIIDTGMKVCLFINFRRSFRNYLVISYKH